MAGQKARIDKDSNVYLSKNARPEAEAETAYDSNDELESDDLSNDRNGNGPDVFKGSTKKDRSRKADQVTTGTEGDMGSALEKMENSNPFFNTLRSRFFAEAENPGVAQAPATSDSPSLGMMAVNNTDFRQPQADVKSVLESIALQAAEAFEMLDENSNVPDAITNELQNTAKAITKIYEFASKGQSQDGTGETSDAPAVGKDAAVGKPGVNEEADQIDELSKELTRSYFNKALDSGVRAASRQWRPGSTSDANAAAAVAKKRAKGLKMASKKMAQEEAEQLDELSPKTLGSYIKRASTQAFGKGYTGGSMMVRGDMNRDKEEENIGKKTVDKGVRRLAGISKATDKLTKEEAEQIDELSKETMKSYVKKALDPNSEKSVSNLASKGGYEYGQATDPGSRAGEKEDAKSVVRSKGIMRAVNKLTKEEAVDEALIGKQHKIDANKNGRLDAHDFKLLRAKKTMKEATDIVFKTLLKGRLDADN